MAWTLSLHHKEGKEDRMTGKQKEAMIPKWQLPGIDAGHFYRDDQQLRRSFQPWLRWLPSPILWRISVWMYKK